MFVNEDWMWSSWTNIRRRGGEASLIFTVWYSVCALFWDLSAQSWSSSNSAASSNSNSCSAALYKTKVGLTCSVSVECMQEKKNPSEQLKSICNRTCQTESEQISGPITSLALVVEGETIWCIQTPLCNTLCHYLLFAPDLSVMMWDFDPTRFLHTCSDKSWLPPPFSAVSFLFCTFTCGFVSQTMSTSLFSSHKHSKHKRLSEKGKPNTKSLAKRFCWLVWSKNGSAPKTEQVKSPSPLWHYGPPGRRPGHNVVF